VGKGLDAYVAVDASGTFSETKRQAGLLRMLQAGVIVSDYATLMVEILKDNGRPEAGDVYTAMDMGWATLVGQIARAYGKKTDQRGARRMWINGIRAALGQQRQSLLLLRLQRPSVRFRKEKGASHAAAESEKAA
jgi:hypothetical protein